MDLKKKSIFIRNNLSKCFTGEVFSLTDYFFFLKPYRFS